DDQDYLDRREVAYSVTHFVREVDRALFTTEIAYVEDRPEVARLSYAVLRRSTSFRPNRIAFEGRYGRASAVLEYHPRVTGLSLGSGVGARLAYQMASGDLDWQR